MADTSPERGRWALRPVPPDARSIAELIRGGTLDSELAATIWLLLEARVPLLVAWEDQGTGKTTLAQVIANSTRSHFITMNAVLAGVKELREAVEVATKNRDS